MYLNLPRNNTDNTRPTKSDTAAVEKRHIESIGTSLDLGENLAIVLRDSHWQSLTALLHLSVWLPIESSSRDTFKIRVLEGRLVTVQKLKDQEWSYHITYLCAKVVLHTLSKNSLGNVSCNKGSHDEGVVAQERVLEEQSRGRSNSYRFCDWGDAVWLMFNVVDLLAVVCWCSVSEAASGGAIPRM